MTGPRVAIVGGGVIGLALAYQLGRDGARVTVLDDRPTGQGASSVNAGWVCPAEAMPVPAPGMVRQGLRWMLRRDSPLYIRPSLEPSFIRFMLRMARHCNATDFRAGTEALLRLSEGTMDLFDAYRADGVDFEMHVDGLIEAYLSREKLDARTRHLGMAEAHGVEAEVLDADALRVKEPALTDGVVGGVWCPGERHLDPASLVRSLQQRCAELGVVFISDTHIDAVTGHLDRVTEVRSGARSFATDAVVLASGAWSGRLAGLFGASLPIRSGKGYSVDLPSFDLQRPVYLSEARVAVTPLDRGLRLSGTMEFGRLDEGVDTIRASAVANAPAPYFRGWQPPVDPTISAGLRPMTPDGLPLLGRLEPWDNAYISTGHAMLGVTLAPSSARLMSRLILRGETDQMLDAFRPERFRRSR